MSDKFSDHESFVDKILTSKKFIKLYESWKQHKNKYNYKLLASFLIKKCNKHSSSFFLTDDTNNFIFNSKLNCTYKKYINGEIISSNKYMTQTFKDSNLNGQSNTYVEIFDKDMKTITKYTYVAKKFNSSGGSGITEVCTFNSDGIPVSCTIY